MLKAVGFTLDHFMDGLKLLAVLGLVLAMADIFVIAIKPNVVIEHLGVPPSLQAEGYTEHSVAARLSAHLANIVVEADSNRETNVGVAGAALGSELRDIELPDTGLTLRWLILRLKQLLRLPHASVRIDILCHSGHIAIDLQIDKDFGTQLNYDHIHADTDVVAAHRPVSLGVPEEKVSRQAESTVGFDGKCHPDSGLDPALIKVAETITRWVDPYILALYKYRLKNNEFVEVITDQMRVQGDRAQRPWFTNLQGLVRWRQGDVQAALSLFREAQNNQDLFVGAAINEISLELKQDNFDRGIQLLRDLEKRAFHPANHGNIERRRDFGEIYFLKALAALHQKDFLAAERLFERAIWHHPYHWETAFNLGLVKERLAVDLDQRARYLGEALGSFRRAAAIKPRDPATWEKRMLLAFELGHLGEALRAYGIRLKYAEMNGLEHMKGGIAAFHLKQYRTAEASLLAAKKVLVADSFFCRWTNAIYDKLVDGPDPLVQDKEAAKELLRQCTAAASEKTVRDSSKALLDRLKN